MNTIEENVSLSNGELDDNMLESVSGGYNAGDVVKCKNNTLEYCKGCGRLITNVEATITGVRGVLDGKTVYWIKRNCCGYKTSVIEDYIE